MAFDVRAPYVFGNSFDSLANQELQYNTLAVQTGEEQQRRAQQAIDQRNALAAQQQREQAAQARQDAATQYQFNQDAYQRQQNQAATDWQKYTFGQQQQQDKQKAAENAKQFGETLDLERDKLAATRQAQGVAAGANDLEMALKMIDSGDIKSADDLSKTFPSLTPRQAQLATAHLTGRSDAEKGMANQAWQTAVAANAELSNSLKQNPMPQGQPVDQNEAENRLLKTPLRTALKDLYWDQANQRFVPTIQPPAGWTPPGTAPSPQSGTSSGARPAFQFPPTAGTGTNGAAPPTVPPGGTATGTVGRPILPGMVRMISPLGISVLIPQANVQQAIARGARLAPQGSLVGPASPPYAFSPSVQPSQADMQ